ncbi:MAG: VOC family protein [Planctomycetales bacterium]
MAKKKVQPVPKGYHTVTPHLVLDECAKAIEFYRRAFGAEETARMPGPGGKVVHAEIRVGDSPVMLADEMPPMPGQPGAYKSPRSAGLSTASLFLYVPDVDAAFERAVKAGCTVRMPVTDMFWGDRFGQVIDPFGHTWGLATHVEDVSPEEMARRHEEFVAQMQPGRPPAAERPKDKRGAKKKGTQAAPARKPAAKPAAKKKRPARR